MNYQKVYMNQIYSSSLMGQVAQMWRNHLLCDAVIKTGNINTKAHRLVMIAACPMLQHMENAAVGSHLEVRLSADIKQESVQTFLQYLYEGFMKLTEDNCKDIEKIGKLLHVDSVVKCCADFYKCLNSKTGAGGYDGSKFDTLDNAEFKHVRTTNMEKTVHESVLKRQSDLPASPSGKRQRVSCPSSPQVRTDDRFSMSHSYSSQDTFDRIPTSSSSSQYQRPTNVIEIAEDSVEVVSSDPRERDAEGWPTESDLPPVQHSMGISVTGQVTQETDLQIVNISGMDPQHPQRRGGANASFSDTSSSSRRVDNVSSSARHSKQNMYSQDSTFHPPNQSGGSPRLSHSDTFSPVQTSSLRPQFQSTPMSSKGSQPPLLRPGYQFKPYAAGSASQTQSHPPPLGHLPAVTTQSIPSPLNISSQHPGQSTSGLKSPLDNKPETMTGQTGQSQSESVDRLLASDGAGSSTTQQGQSENQTDNHSDMADITIVKIEEAGDTGGLDMYVDIPDKDKGEEDSGGGGREEIEGEEAGDWNKEDYSNEGSFAIDPNTSWQGDSSFNKGKYDKGVEVFPPAGSYEGIVSKPFVCKHCARLFINYTDFLKHMFEEEKTLVCAICRVCSKYFVSADGFKKHVKMVHLASEDCPCCKTCGKRFQSRAHLRRHEITHSTEKPFKCPKCSLGFKGRKFYYRHMAEGCKAVRLRD